MTNTLGISAVAKAAGVTRHTIYNWIKNGKMPVQSIEGSKPPRWNEAEIFAWLAPRPQVEADREILD